MKRLRARLAALALAGAAALAGGQPSPAPRPAGERPRTEDAAYVHWLEQRSMLHQAQLLARRYSGHSIQWQHPYGIPEPQLAVARASVWFTAYPASTIPASPGES
ncbi:MAG: maltose alpha-D-glucosyltransferase, partial [Steroidobacteraceae bacterium]